MTPAGSDAKRRVVSTSLPVSLNLYFESFPANSIGIYNYRSVISSERLVATYLSYSESKLIYYRAKGDELI